MENKKIYALAAFTYLFLAPFFFHPDLKTIFYQSQFLTKGVVNIYQFLQANPDKAFSGPFVYPPLAYFLLGTIYPVVKLIGGSGFVQWLAMGNDAVGVSHIFRYIFAIKLPFIFMHFLTAFYFAKWIKDEKVKKYFLLLWFFNPISIYVVALMGQIDIVAVFFTVLALYFIDKRSNLSAVMLGMGAAFKTYPILLLPFAAILISKDWKKRIVNFGIGILTYLLFIIPFLRTPAFFSDTLTSGLSQRLLELGINSGYGEMLLIVPIILAILFIHTLNGKVNNKSLLKYFFIVTSTVVVSVHFHPQWGMWLLPFLIYILMTLSNLTSDQKWISGILFFTGFLGTVFLYNDVFLSFGLLSPIDAGVLFLPAPSTLLQKFIDPVTIQSVFHSVSAGVVIWLIYKESKAKKAYE